MRLTSEIGHKGQKQVLSHKEVKAYLALPIWVRGESS